MHKIDTEFTSPTMPPMLTGVNSGWFHGGGAGTRPTKVGRDWYNMVQAEFLAILAEAGITPDKSKLNQLAISIKAIVAADTGDIINGAITAHINASDPHSQYAKKTQVTTDIASAVTAHEAKADPHTQYAKKTQVTTDIASAVTAHEAKADPHTQYAQKTQVTTDIASAVTAHEAKADPHTQYAQKTQVATDITSAVTAHEAKTDPHTQYAQKTQVTTDIGGAISAHKYEDAAHGGDKIWFDNTGSSLSSDSAGEAIKELDVKSVALSQAIANLAGAQGQIHSDTTPALAEIPQVESDVTFSVLTPSSNTDILEFDATANTITFKADGNYNFLTSISLDINTNAARNITFRTKDSSNNAVVTERILSIDNTNNSNSQFVSNQLITVGSNGIPSAPLTIKLSAQSNGTSIGLTAFDILITSSATGSIIQLSDNPNLNDPAIAASTKATKTLSDKIKTPVMKRTVFDTPGSHTFTKPANAIDNLKVTLVGAGGGAQGGRAGGGGAGGAGGTITGYSSASSITFTIGAGGAGGAPGAAGTIGTATTAYSFTASPGFGGATNGAAGGNPSGSGVQLTDVLFQAGGAGGGGNYPVSGSSSVSQGQSSGAANTSVKYGAGGKPPFNSSSNGGNGADGIVIIEYLIGE